MRRPTYKLMLAILLSCLGVFYLSLCASENPVGSGTLSPESALTECLPIRKVAETNLFPYRIDGHQWLTLRIAMAATGNYQLAHGLAYYSQYPDIDYSYEAIRQAKIIIDLDWQESIMGDLHSLHGGDACAVQLRRSHLRNGVAYWYHLEGSEVWQTGLIIHALGDSYAHTEGELNSLDEKAYGRPFGHAVDSIVGPDPDTIANFKPKAIEFATKLYGALIGPGDKTNAEFDAIIEEIRSCQDDSCDFLEGFYPSTDGKESEDEMAAFTDCMNQKAKKLTKEQVLLITSGIATEDNGVDWQ
jgi:hypothetical protein